LIANKDFVTEQLKIDSLYEEGTSIEKDLKMAVYWYEKSAKKGHQKAQCRGWNRARD